MTKKVLLKSTSSPLYNQFHLTKILCRTSGVNFTIILSAAFAPTDFWHMTKSVQHKILAQLLVLGTSRVGHHWHWNWIASFVPNAMRRSIWALHKSVGEIDFWLLASDTKTDRGGLDYNKSAVLNITILLLLLHLTSLVDVI